MSWIFLSYFLLASFFTNHEASMALKHCITRQFH